MTTWTEADRAVIADAAQLDADTAVDRLVEHFGRGSFALIAAARETDRLRTGVRTTETMPTAGGIRVTEQVSPAGA